MLMFVRMFVSCLSRAVNLYFVGQRAIREKSSSQTIQTILSGLISKFILNFHTQINSQAFILGLSIVKDFLLVFGLFR